MLSNLARIVESVHQMTAQRAEVHREWANATLAWNRAVSLIHASTVQGEKELSTMCKSHFVAAANRVDVAL